MNRDFVEMLAGLSAAEAEFLLVGAHALAAHGCPRATGDIDIWVRPTPENAQRVWMALGQALGWVNTRLVLGLIFFGLVTPMALVFRLTGRDPMERALDPHATTYRVPRRPRPGAHMLRQF